MPNKESTFLRLLSAWMPAICVIAIIIWESSAQFSSTNTSTPLRHLWELWIGPVSNAAWLLIHHHIRKAGHVIGYGLLSGFLFRAWFLTIKLPSTRKFFAWQVSTVMALTCTLIIASADEIHQKFIPSRTSSSADVAIDMAGALTVQLLIATYFLLHSRPQQALLTQTGPDS